jgi:hypothetical protein
MISIRTLSRAGLIAAAVMLLPVSQAAAQEFSESHLEAARIAASSSPIAEEFDQVLPLLSQRVQDRLIRLRPDLHEVITETVRKVALDLASRRDDLDNAAALVWARAFTEEELEEIAAFYTSPVGKKFKEVSAQLGADTVQVVQNWSNRVGEELLDKSREELKKLGHEL